MKFAYLMTAEDHDEANRVLADMLPDPYRLVRGMSLIVIAIGFLVFFKDIPFGRQIVSGVLISYGLFILLYPILKFSRSVEEAWDVSFDRIAGAEVEVTSDGILYSRPEFTMFMRWSVFTKWIETRSTFLFFENPTEVILMIAKRSLPSPEQLEEFRSIVRTHLVERAKGFPVIPR